MTYSVGMVSLGCPKNQVDAEMMLAKIGEAGMPIEADAALSDVVIINTCGFIEEAKKEAIETILEFAQLKKEGRIKKIIVTGCMAERYRDEILSELPECDAVTGLGANDSIVETIKRVMEDEIVQEFPSKDFWSLDGERLQTTPSFFAYLRIADGCSNCCTYCAIPKIRGKMRSRKLESILEEAKGLAKNGVKELILVAQDTTRYGEDLYGEKMLPKLLRELNKIEGIEWIRLLYCYPECITDDLLDTMVTCSKIVSYLDIPIQHASGSVLKRMNRSGDVESLTNLFEHIRKKVPGITLRTTVMTGFPGETEQDFEDLCEFIKEIRFDRLGCFAFSPEEGTAAIHLDNPVPQKVKEKRADLVMELQNSILEQHNENLIGTSMTVLIESYDRIAECWFGRTKADAPDIDCKVFFMGKASEYIPGSFVKVRIMDSMDFDLIGEVEK